jgi:hypothetical protein
MHKPIIVPDRHRPAVIEAIENHLLSVVRGVSTNSASNPRDVVFQTDFGTVFWPHRAAAQGPPEAF